MQEKNIYELTEDESALAGLSHPTLLIDAFTAIAKEQLQARFGDGAATVKSIAQPGYTWGDMVGQGIAALERNPRYFARWFRCIFVDPSDYRRWHDHSKSTLAIAEKRAHRVSRKDLEAFALKHIESEHGQGRQACQKRIWDCAKAALPGATQRQVIDAMRAVEGGKKPRGRPRKAKTTVR